MAGVSCVGHVRSSGASVCPLPDGPCRAFRSTPPPDSPTAPRDRHLPAWRVPRPTGGARPIRADRASMPLRPSRDAFDVHRDPAAAEFCAVIRLPS
ncbi:hypothetical protein Salmuc_03842 [Salipiger mucosus DSM 16094]|uniref:Uncharacterized protein n=1 Tax=Salipiger mucosus DSM 16094 TaxID=1123237 RepID=S9RR70_9RHOB|nr:hypothetical protein Salmuc_03842 [Salipiger mucosus DSM 16094]